MEIGSEVSDTELVNNFGQMDQNTWGNGRKEKHMEKVSFSILMETTTRGTGAITKLAGTACTFMKMEISMKGSGKTMFNMVMEKSDGQMALVIKVHITKEQNMELVSISGQTDRNTTGIGTTI